MGSLIIKFKIPLKGKNQLHKYYNPAENAKKGKIDGILPYIYNI